ncbi:hypothetical protein cyc_08677 [Cyclospora cayetanensis]|uniref:Uncharacterized protein n=1 Tax=Cyclospora cayetanensis TaxID=88456 RepID=A0A1D3D1E4_9EIME|nr:hypothetical protein cyc_08677 [Cyclospora cayetanensis]
MTAAPSAAAAVAVSAAAKRRYGERGGEGEGGVAAAAQEDRLPKRHSGDVSHGDDISGKLPNRSSNELSSSISGESIPSSISRRLLRGEQEKQAPSQESLQPLSSASISTLSISMRSAGVSSRQLSLRKDALPEANRMAAASRANFSSPAELGQPGSVAPPWAAPRFHPDAGRVGRLSGGDKRFKKERKGGMISLVYERQLRVGGICAYRYKIAKGPISAADGVGFVFATRVPCGKNIQTLYSVFVNRQGHLCKRRGSLLERRAVEGLEPLQSGCAVTLLIDLMRFIAIFQECWRGTPPAYVETASFQVYGQLPTLQL